MKIFDVVQKCKDAGKLKKSNVNLYRQKVCNKCETLIETLDKNQVKYYNKHVFCDICYEYVQQSLRKNKKFNFAISAEC